LSASRTAKKENSATHGKVAKVGTVVHTEMAGRGLTEKIMAGKGFEKIWREYEFEKWREINSKKIWRKNANIS
jgi:hypothetical protein